MRYTDNPKDGSVTSDYPALGGAYFDADAYHQYPKYGSYDPETGESFNEFGSDSLAKKVVALKKVIIMLLKNMDLGLNILIKFLLIQKLVSLLHTKMV